MKNLFLGAVMVLTSASPALAWEYTLNSPDNNIIASINDNDGLQYSVSLKTKKNLKQIIAPSALSLSTSLGEIAGKNAKIGKPVAKSVSQVIESPFYRSSQIQDNYNSVTIPVGKDWKVEFRAYNDGVAYRYIYTGKKDVTVNSEQVVYNFSGDHAVFAAYTRPRVDEDQYFNQFENLYTTTNLSSLTPKKLILSPMTVDLGDDVKVTVTEADLEQYPGLYYTGVDGHLEGRLAPYPKTCEQGGHNMLQMIVKERENFIAKSKGARSYPWRAAIISNNDKELASSTLVYQLASPSRVTDYSWVKPGKVAWDWWNNWNLKGVDFKAGINNDTYKRYIDFASQNGIEYVILDEGWATKNKADLLDVIPEIDLPMLVEYAKNKNVGIVLWGGYHAFDKDMEKVCKHYADMGVKGFKIDFMDRDDQIIVDFVHRSSQMCAKYKLFLDFHGMYKPAGMNRTYPHVLNFEGVHGLEQMKWSDISKDQVEYDVTIPFIRQIAGPMDYTPGAMRNGTKKTYHKDYREPMSQGTRSRQLALFVVFDSPFTMLCDTPDNYDEEPECRDFIASIPTTWDETRILKGKVGDFICTARRKGDTWYIAGLTDWKGREMNLNLSFIPGNPTVTMIRDGINADKNAKDFKKETFKLSGDKKLKVKMAPGGGFAMIVKQ